MNLRNGADKAIVKLFFTCFLREFRGLVLRIVHLSTRLDYYGGEVCLANLATGFAANGHDVSCLVRPGSVLAARLSGGPVEVVTLPMVDWYDPGTIHRVGGWLRHRQADILATHLPRDYFIAAVAGSGLPVCNIATRHHLKPLSLPILKRPFLRRFGAVVAVSEAVARVVRQARLVAAERVVTVPNGIAAPGPPDSGLSLRERAGVSAAAPVVGLVGKLCAEKGADVLLRAVGRLACDLPDLQVFLVGAGERDDSYREHLVRLARTLGLAGRVHFFGFVPDVARRCREFDVQVVASSAEPFGLVTLEAMACGVPVVATAAGGSPEIIHDGVEGFLVPPGQVDVLANRLACLLGSAGLRRQMGQRGRHRFRERFTVERMVRDTEAVYRMALEPRQPGVLVARS